MSTQYHDSPRLTHRTITPLHIVTMLLLSACVLGNPYRNENMANVNKDVFGITGVTTKLVFGKVRHKICLCDSSFALILTFTKKVLMEANVTNKTVLCSLRLT